MAQARFAYRFTGVLWVTIGSLVLLISVGFLISAVALLGFFNAQLPEVASLFAPSLRVLPSLQQALGVIVGIFCITIGAGLFALASWARTVGVAFNISMGACVGVMTVALYLSLANSDNGSVLGALVLLIGGALAVFLVFIGYKLSTQNAMDAFFGILPQAPAMKPVICPTCNSPLNLSSATCPKCDSDHDVVVMRAKLVSLDTGQEYPVSLKKATRIGRETPGFEIQLDEQTVSHEHATIEYVDGHFYLHALRATNGTFVNDLSCPVMDVEIKNGDLVAFAAVHFRFVVE